MSSSRPVPAGNPPGRDSIDRQLVEHVQVYLELRRRGDDPDPMLNEDWEQFYQITSLLLGRLRQPRGLPTAGRQDRIQDIWLRLLTRLPRLQADPDRGSVQGWLITLARNVVRERGRFERRRPAELLDLDQVDSLPGSDPDPALSLDRQRVQELVQVALAELHGRVSEKSYQVLYQHWIADRRFDEIAQDLGLTPGQARDRHARMIRLLRRLLMNRKGRL